jgi:hypothetical protein
MNVARDLLGDLAVIGATIKPAGDRLILRAGHTAIPAALVNRVREAKVDLLAALAPCTDCVEVSGGTEKECGGNPPLYESKNRTFEARIVEWLDQHPAPTTPGRCGWCGSPESPGAVVLPFGVEPGKHAWLHAECWPIWYNTRGHHHADGNGPRAGELCHRSPATAGKAALPGCDRVKPF